MISRKPSPAGSHGFRIPSRSLFGRTPAAPMVSHISSTELIVVPLGTKRNGCRGRIQSTSCASPRVSARWWTWRAGKPTTIIRLRSSKRTSPVCRIRWSSTSCTAGTMSSPVGLVGFTVNLAWVRQAYFQELIPEIARVAGDPHGNVVHHLRRIPPSRSERRLSVRTRIFLRQNVRFR